ncbi:hypothetical protein ACIA5D_31710 [Actinoplanes sp. NPDC051513]|uniref:hypothetical protein n=1 Tax=Actinoplanes sp. NPDC051513 TaxID=3363908 RepID=UPI00379022FB
MSSDPERLDLAAHDPEEYEGKYLDIHDVRYLVGPLLGHGEEKIVHALFNAESKMSLHVLRVHRERVRPWRDLDLIHSVERGFAGSGEVPFAAFMDVPYPGFWVDIQEREPPVDGNGARTLPGGASLSMINEVLAVNAAHTGALMAKAEWYARRPGGTAAATCFALRAVEIEPNFLPYLLRTVALAIESRDYAEAVATHTLIKQKYDYNRQADLSVAALHLAFGEPAAAAVVRARYPLEETPCDQATIDKLDEAICTALANRLESDRLGARAYGHLHGVSTTDDGYGRALADVEKAVAVHPESPRMQANRGLLLTLTGRHREGAEQLVEWAPALPMAARIICLISAAYAYLRAGDLARAAAAHSTALTWLGGLMDLEALDGESFPRPAQWIPAGGRPHNAGTAADAAEIIAKTLEAAGTDEGEDVQYFAALLGFFRAHLAELEQQFAEYTAKFGPGVRVPSA